MKSFISDSQYVYNQNLASGDRYVKRGPSDNYSNTNFATKDDLINTNNNQLRYNKNIGLNDIHESSRVTENGLAQIVDNHKDRKMFGAFLNKDMMGRPVKTFNGNMNTREQLDFLNKSGVKGADRLVGNRGGQSRGLLREEKCRGGARAWVGDKARNRLNMTDGGVVQGGLH